MCESTTQLVRSSAMAARIALDANILLVLAFGSVDVELLGKRRRVREYRPNDYKTALDIVSGYQQVVVTPNVVAECSDLLSDDGDFREKQWLKAFLEIDERACIEEYVPGKEAASLEQYRYLGVADCSLLSLVDEDTVLLTADSKLYLAAADLNPRCMNFNHMRNFL